MTTINPALTRAKKVLAANGYFALATNDAEGPWVAALAHTFVAPNYLCFFSQATSRHGAAIKGGARVAGLLYDSQCTFEEVESIQFSGWGDVPRDRETIAALLTAINAKDGNLPPTDEDIDKRLADTSSLLFRISINDAYVLDQHLFHEQGIDARERVDVLAMFSDERL